MVEISATPPALVPDIWDDVYPFFKSAVDADIFLSEERLRADLINDKSLLFIATMDNVIKGAAIVRIEETKNRVANIVMLGGERLEDWKSAMLSALEVYAKDTGCKYIASTGRKAWGRILRDFMADRILFYKEI